MRIELAVMTEAIRPVALKIVAVKTPNRIPMSPPNRLKVTVSIRNG